MIFTARMNYIEIMVLKKDFKKTLDILSDFGCLEIKVEHIDKKTSVKQDYKSKDTNWDLYELENTINDIVDFLKIEKSNKKGILSDFIKVKKYFLRLYSKIEQKKDELLFLVKKKKELEYKLKEKEPYRNLKISKNELKNLNFIHTASGIVLEKENLNKLKEKMHDNLDYIELDNKIYIFFTSKKNKWALDSELKRINFHSIELPFEGNDLPSDMYSNLKKELFKIESRIEKIDNFRSNLLKEESKDLIKMIESYNLHKIFQNIFDITNHTTTASVICGWVINKKLKILFDELKDAFHDRFSMTIHEPHELDNVRNGKTAVPVILENPKILKPFENIVYNYGAPSYGMIDPTLFVAISFFLFYGFMFGDLGQGFIIFITGLFLKIFNIKKLEKIKPLTPLLIYFGISAMIFGYLFGSIFCYEHENNFFTPINRYLFGIDKSYLVDTSMNNIINIALISIGIGLFMNLLGIFFNIINNFKLKNYYEVIISRNGMTGFIFLLSIFLIFLELIFKIYIISFPVFFLCILLSLILISIKEPLYRILHKKKPIFHEGFGIWIFHAVIEIYDIILITISNNLSFIRVGAFSIIHGLLSLIFVKIASFLGNYGIIIIILGNIILILLEGLIVAIQIMRLEYYEFFSKFFFQKGKIFIPFKIEKNKV